MNRVYPIEYGFIRKQIIHKQIIHKQIINKPSRKVKHSAPVTPELNAGFVNPVQVKRKPDNELKIQIYQVPVNQAKYGQIKLV